MIGNLRYMYSAKEWIAGELGEDAITGRSTTTGGDLL
jgi:hypothetical protein